MDIKTIGKWGNSLAVRFNSTLLDAVSKIKNGDDVKITYEENKIIIEKIKK